MGTLGYGTRDSTWALCLADYPGGSVQSNKGQLTQGSRHCNHVWLVAGIPTCLRVSKTGWGMLFPWLHQASQAMGLDSPATRSCFCFFLSDTAMFSTTQRMQYFSPSTANSSPGHKFQEASGYTAADRGLVSVPLIVSTSGIWSWVSRNDREYGRENNSIWGSKKQISLLRKSKAW